MEHGVVWIVVRSLLFELIERFFEREPLGYPDFEAVLLFELFEDEEVLPVAEVLDAGDAVRKSVGDCELVAAHAFFVCRRRNDFVDQLLCGLAEDAGGLSAGVVIDRSSLGRYCRGRDTRGFECGGVGD